jgi:hypothetical protein
MSKEGGKRVVIESTRPTRDDLTPITDIRGMGQAIAIIKRDVREMRPEVKETARAIIEVTTKQEVADGRIKMLETKTDRLNRQTASLAQPRPHDCMNANVISDIQEETKKNALSVVNVTRDASSAVADIDELKKGQSKFIYWLLGAAVLVISSMGGWYASYQVTTNEVRHLTEEQTKIRTNLETLQTTTKNLPSKINNAASRMESAAVQMEKGEISIEEVWCDLKKTTKIRLEKELSPDKIPRVRCDK